MKIKHLILIILYIIIQILLKDVWLHVYKIESMDVISIEKTFNTFISIIFAFNFIILLILILGSIFILIMRITCIINTGKINSFLNKKLF